MSYNEKLKVIEVARLTGNAKYENISFNDLEDAEKYKNSIDDNDIVDITIAHYLSLPKTEQKTFKMFKSACVNWPEKKTEQDPYEFGLGVKDFIPYDYIVNSREVRTRLLDAIISVHGKHCSIFVNLPNHIKNLPVLIRSLGFPLYEKDDKIILVKSHKPHICDFELVKKPISPFVGWQLEGTGRFLLRDFTVTHNTPEGQKIGVVMNLALTAKITKKVPKVLVKNILSKCKNIIHIDDEKFPLNAIKNLTPVFLNGSIIGFSSDPEDTMSEIKKKRDCGLLDSELSISYDMVDDDIRIYCDEGRFCRPLLALKDNQLLIKGSDSYNWTDLVKKGVIRYVDAAEIENSVIAMDSDMLKIQYNDFCEIHPCAMLGIMAALIPFADHSQSPRNCYQCLWIEEEVLMATGEYKKIKDVEVGDDIVTVNPATCEKSITKVINQYVKETDKKIVEVTTISGRKLVCTDDHPILTENGWKRAGELSDRDRISVFVNKNEECERYRNLTDKTSDEWFRQISEKGESIFVPVKSVIEKENVLIADITTASETHSFITGQGICVHNSSMGKQALGIPILSHNLRTDTILHVLHYPQRPLVCTKFADIFKINEMPSGINAIVAIACYSGYNQEDSVMMNLSAIQRGLFCLTSYHSIDCCEKKRDAYSFEEICLPPKNTGKEGEIGHFKRKNANYSLLDEHGVVRPRERFEDGRWVGTATTVKKGDVIIGKVVSTTNKAGEETKVDASVVIQPGEEGVIDRVFTLTTPNGYKLVKIVIRVTREPTLGDKLASRAAQKGTVGMIYRQEDMPFTCSGICPDIIINPCCIPSRMTINQLIECALGKECTFTGEYGDATPFTSTSVNAADKLVSRIEKTMGEYGFQAQGWERMYNGMTGDMIESRIFIGPTYYQRLKHMVDDKMHARAQGHVTMLTRQPLEGRSRDGGLRFGIKLPKWHVIMLLVYSTVGNTIKFRGTPKALYTNLKGKLLRGLGENSRVVIIIVIGQS
jgi:DNA-directed RNA polymerase II subunit RPB2